MGGSVDQDGHPASVGDLEHNLLGAHGLAVAQGLRQGAGLQGDRAAVRPVDGHDLQQLLQGLLRGAQALEDADHLPVERRHRRLPVEDDDPHGRGVDQGLQVGPRPLFVPVAPGVGDDQRRLRGEHHQGLLVFPGETSLSLLVAEEDVARVVVPVADRRCQKGEAGAFRDGQRQLGQAQGPDVVVEVLHPQRFPGPAQGFEEAHPRQLPEPPGLFGGQSGDQEVQGPSFLVQQDDQAVAGFDQGPGVFQHLLQHGVDIEALVDAQARFAQPRQAFPKRLDLSLEGFL